MLKRGFLSVVLPMTFNSQIAKQFLLKMHFCINLASFLLKQLRQDTVLLIYNLKTYLFFFLTCLHEVITFISDLKLKKA